MTSKVIFQQILKERKESQENEELNQKKLKKISKNLEHTQFFRTFCGWKYIKRIVREF